MNPHESAARERKVGAVLAAILSAAPRDQRLSATLAQVRKLSPEMWRTLAVYAGQRQLSAATKARLLERLEQLVDRTERAAELRRAS